MLNYRLFICILTCLFSSRCYADTAYWQQKVDTRIQVTLNDTTHFLNAFLEMDYQNNSPDTLNFIYFHLWPNAYKNDRTAYEQQAVEDGNTDHYFSKKEDRGYIDSISFIVNNEKADIVATRYEDVVRLILPAPLLPGEKLTISTPFRVKIPRTFSRLGHEGQSYQISQWFPKPAVYDRYGWHPMPYLDQGEFYSEFGSYDVAITLPENYILMATGNIREQSEITWLDSLSRLPMPDDTLFKRGDIPPSSQRLKTVHFREDNIHDFAWFADKRWVVRKERFRVNDTAEEITAYTCFFPWHQKGWKNSVSTVRKTVAEFSARVGVYPYKTVKAVEGDLISGSGMEYPTIALIQPLNSEPAVDVVLTHEVGHNWFYGILGSNERQHAWLDESINSFYEHKIQPGVKKDSALKGNNKDFDFLGYARLAATRDLLPADTVAGVYTPANYSGDVYNKTAYMLNWLEAYMGSSDFEKAMKEYFSVWKFKHPYPADLEKIFRRNTGKDLDWFFTDALHSRKSVDFKIKSIRTDGDTVRIKVKNRTGFNGPVLVEMTGTDAVGNQLTDSAWSAPFSSTAYLPIPRKKGIKWVQARVSAVIPDYKTDNDLYKGRSTFHPKLSPFLGLNMGYKSPCWIAPAAGYNYYDGFMAGILLHNLSLPQNKFQYAIAPLYGFGSGQLTGTAVAGYTAYMDKGWLHDMQFNILGKTFSYGKTGLNIPDNIYSRYIKIAPEIIFNIRKPYPRSSVQRSLSLKGYWIREDKLQFSLDPSDSLYRPAKDGYDDNFYGKIRYTHDNSRTFNPFSYSFEGQAGKLFAKISLEANLRIDYFKKNKALYIRGYAGKFFSFADNDFDAYRYRLATTYSGANDYLYDETYLGRNEQTGFTSQQISNKEGGFKINTLQYANQIGLSDDWLFALNIKTDLPFWNLPVRLFADIATFSGAKQQNPSGAGVLYAAGIQLYAWDYLTVNIPLIMSKDYKEYKDAVLGKNSFAKMITFSINLGNINWLKLPRKILE